MVQRKAQRYKLTMIKNTHFETFKKLDMKTTIDKSRLMKRAWWLVKNKGYNLAYAMKKVWAEMKAYIVEKALEAAAIIEMEKLQAWWATDEYKAWKIADNGTFKQFAHDKNK